MNKTQKVVLIAGSILIAISAIMISITTYKNYFPDNILNYFSIKNPDAYKYVPFESAISKIILIKANVILSEIIWTEIIWIKNIHTLLATGQQEYRKLLCSISLVLLFGVVILLCMYEKTYLRHDVTNICYLYTAWFFMIISFILGAIRVKTKKHSSPPL